MSIKFNPMNVDFETSEKLIYTEIDNLRKIITLLKEEFDFTNSNYKLILQPNQTFLSNIVLDGKSLLVQVNKPYVDSSMDSYLLLAIVDGVFNKNGMAYHPVKKISVIRLDVIFKEDGCNWRDREGNNHEFTSEEIIRIWWNKFLAFIQKTKNNS